MPEIREWEEREFTANRRASSASVSRPRQRDREPDSHRTIDRSSNPSRKILKYAERYRRDGPGAAAITPDRKILCHLAEICHERSGLLGRSSRHTEALVAVSAHWRDWLQPLDRWEPPDADSTGQFGSLTRHLFSRYEVPRFLDGAWFAGLGVEGVRYQNWFKQIGCGESLRSLIDLPIPLTKAMAHAFAHAPDDLDVPSALRWAQVRGLGGDDRLARIVLDSRIGTDFTHDDFWTSVIRWLIAHPELRPRHHGPVIDYLYNQKFVPSVANPMSRRRGRARQPLVIVPQPNLCMRGRTPDSMLRAVEEWHKSLGSQHRGMGVEWKPSSIPPFSCEVGVGAAKTIFAITELISSEELQEEGQVMVHCVATYWMLCYSGQRSVWSLTAEDAEGNSTRLLTIEVYSANNRLVQARGPHNRDPAGREWELLRQWSECGGPSLNPFLMAGWAEA